MLNKDAEQYFSAIEALSEAVNRHEALPDFLVTAVKVVESRMPVTQAAVIVSSGSGEWHIAATGQALSGDQQKWLRSRTGLLALGSQTADVSLLSQSGSLSESRLVAGSDSRSGILSSLPCGEAGRGLLFLAFRNDRLFSDCDVRFIRAVANLIGGAISHAERMADPLIALVERAKLEWEATVDALPQLICVLDRQGRVLRGNRALEEWGIGRVGELIGREAGCVLHPLCPDRHCDRRQEYDRFWKSGGCHAVEWETECPAVGRVVRLVLRRLPKGAGDELRDFAVLTVEDITRTKHASIREDEHRRELERQIAERTRQLQESNGRLQEELHNHRRDKVAILKLDNERRQLSQRLLESQETERQRIARELHDGLGQTLTAVKLGLESCLLRHERNGALDTELLTDTMTRVKGAIEETRRVALDLRPPMLDDLGLISTLKWLCNDYRRLCGHLEAQFEVSEHLVDDDLRIAIFRICQEALNNVAKHAVAAVTRVRLYVENEKLWLRIDDDGVGLGPRREASASGGFGLSSMRQRAELTGGSLTVEGREQGGVTVAASWPLATAARGVLPPRPLPRFGKLPLTRRISPRQTAGGE